MTEYYDLKIPICPHCNSPQTDFPGVADDQDNEWEAHDMWGETASCNLRCEVCSKEFHCTVEVVHLYSTAPKK